MLSAICCQAALSRERTTVRSIFELRLVIDELIRQKARGGTPPVAANTSPIESVGLEQTNVLETLEDSRSIAFDRGGQRSAQPRSANVFSAGLNDLPSCTALCRDRTVTEV